MGKKNRGMRANWDEEMMEEALNLIKQGKSQRYVENHCGIPRRTLRAHIKSGISKRKLGRHPILNSELESELEAKIIRFAERGFPLTPKTIRRCVFAFVDKKKIPNPFSATHKLAGREWYRAFLKRNTAISLRRAQNMNPARAQKLNKPIVQDYFNKLNNLLERIGVKNKPEKIYNMDEKGCRLNLHHQQRVLARKGAKRVHLVAHEHAENVSIVGCANALGQVIPPMILFKGKRLKPTFEDGLPGGSVVHMTPKGSMIQEVFVKWLEHFAKYMSAPPVVLIFDGASCHLDISIAERAEELGIHLMCLPSNTTHELQPMMDKAVFRSFEHHWDEELLRYWEHHPTRTLNKERFSDIFTPVWGKCMTIANITNGFRATGIYPLNIDPIAEYAFAPSLATLRNIEDENNDNSSPEDDVPLASLRDETKKANNSFSEVLVTPEVKIKPNAPIRKKALNYKALEVTKKLFKDTTNVQGQPQLAKKTHAKTSSAEPQPSSSKGRINKENWLCAGCHKNFVADMRQCTECKLWFHEECVGLTEDDDEPFVCAFCEEK
ncbi:uncharacterized protein LOC116158793 [Photinus pyralis]|nr:uncharacterized protein LOC116158793 [Photinus pyralis]